MKKILATFVILLFVIGCNVAYAAVQENSMLDSKMESNLVEIKDREVKTLEHYKEVYGSDAYGLTAYILNRVRIFSIPIAFIAIAIAAIFQYVLGIRKLDVRDKGFALMITSVTLLVICQVLPLIFAIVVKGWRG